MSTRPDSPPDKRAGTVPDNEHCDAPCDGLEVHPEAIAAVRSVLQDADAEGMLDMIELFRAIAEPTRLRILLALAVAELCVCDLAELTNVSSSAVSHQLRRLRAMRLVRYRKQGKNAYYRLANPAIIDLLRDAATCLGDRALSSRLDSITERTSA
jgi:DNA-binding transcriptional ArsR family regulator